MTWRCWGTEILSLCSNGGNPPCFSLLLICFMHPGVFSHPLLYPPPMSRVCVEWVGYQPQPHPCQLKQVQLVLRWEGI